MKNDLIRRKSNVILHRDSCKVEIADPYDKRILSQFSPQDQIKPKCEPWDKEKSTLVDGVLMMTNVTENEKCLYSCITAGFNTIILDYSDWKRIPNKGVEPQCDIIEVQCSINGKQSYKFLHHQLVKKQTKVSIPSTKPDVHVFILDSASMSHVIRALPKTLDYLKNSMGATIFPYNNKAQYKTKPNSYIIYHNKRITETKKTPTSRPFYTYSRTEIDACAANSTYIPRLYKQKGYRVLLDEDWSENMMEGCKPGETHPIDHNLIPFWNRLRDMFADSNQLKTLHKPEDIENYHTNLWDRFCYERHDRMLKYLDQFIDAYDDEPKISFSWFGYLMHDVRSDLFMYDEDFLQFFQKMSKKFENSHIFFMADHGSRIYPDESLFLDRIEDYNPALVYKPPKKLLNNQKLKEQLEINSQQLVSHFDVYATLIDILQNGDAFDTDYDFESPAVSDPTIPLTGSSLLRPLPQPRNCETLGLHFEACLCQLHGNPEPEMANNLTYRLAEAAVDYINYHLTISNITAAVRMDQACANLTVSNHFTPIAEKYSTKNDQENVYRVTFKTSPGEALFDPYLQVHENGEIEVVSTWFKRKNRYRAQVGCLQEITGVKMDYSDDFCYCKNLLN
ncbi:unnamed protein product [Bursaphelenchus xylophilus]|uniref:(pine wood nematode) hypothetical protein n=1 Tax=Bursaphelenchus xylophilus TaxID=6326 RepID=A0A1I7S509_BURXY|nr:unnamed protein product [Bursaphelenchus xylophilus]CAG9117583.1 unnamed protein product [Bursaphelenchus xylophilus]